MSGLDCHLARSFGRLAQICAVLCGIISLSSLMGWAAGWLFIARLSPDYIPMAPSTALAGVLLSMGLFVYVRWPVHLLRHVFVIIAAVIVSGFAVMLLLRFVGVFVLDLEEFLLKNPESFRGVSIGRMSPLTAVGFLLGGLSLLALLLSSPGWVTGQCLSVCLALSMTIISLVVLLGYAYGTPLLYGGAIIPVALPTAISLLLLGLGLLSAADKRVFPLHIFPGGSVRDQLVRAFLPAMLIIVVGEDWLIRMLLPRNSVNPALLVALMALVSVVVVIGVVVFVSRSIGGAIERAKVALEKSEERFALAVCGTNDGIWDWNILTNEIYFSNRLCELLGHEANELIPKYDTWVLLLHPDDRDRVLDCVRRHVGEHIPYNVEYRMRTKSGEYRWFLARGQAVWDQTGNPVRMVGSITDIAGRKRMEEEIKRTNETLELRVQERTSALLKSEERFELAVRGANDGIWDWDIVTDNCYFSNHFFELIGYEPHELPQKYETWMSLVHPDDHELMIGCLNKHLKEHAVYNPEFRMRMKKGEYRWFQAKGQVVLNQTGNPVRIVGSITDVTGRRRAEEEVRLLQEITIAITEADDFHSAMRIVLEKVCKSTGWVYGEVWLPSWDKTYLSFNQAWCDINEILSKFARQSRQFTFRCGVGLPGRTWASKGPEWIRDVTADANFPRAKVAMEFGFKAAMGVPVLANREVVAVLTFFVREIKDEDERLIKLVSTIAVQLGTVVQRKQINDEIRRLSFAIEQSPTCIIITDTGGNIEYVNPQFEKLTGYTIEEVKGKTPRFLKSGKTTSEEYKQLWNTITAGGAWRGEFQNKKKNGEFYWELANIFPSRKANGVVSHYIAFKEDITGFKKLDADKNVLKDQLYHAQKLESIGRLAGGVAHDFNNLLMAISGYAQLLEMETNEDDTRLDYIHKILQSTATATQITQGLLAISKRQVVNPKPLDLNAVIKKTAGVLERFITEDIKFQVVLTGKDCVVMANESQMEQVLMNLVNNAKDAMPKGGSLTISTDIVELGEEFAKIHAYNGLGGHVLVSVSDTGIGMDAETKGQIFDPFFTTKETGRGTGLGLAIVYGIIQQHNGYTDVQSEPGKGTTFRIYLPGIESKAEEIRTEIQNIPTEGTETILLAEDEENVRSFVKIVLEKHGYTVIDAVDGEDAVNKFLANKEKVQLFLSDVIMPKRNGKEAYYAIRNIVSDVKVVFMSGYTKDVIGEKDATEEGFDFISKPVSPPELLKMVRGALDKA